MSPWLKLLSQQRLFAVIRASTAAVALKMAEIAAASGFRLLEITWNTPDAALIIAQLSQQLPECHIGAGTILDIQMAEAAIRCGSKFLFSPAHKKSVIKLANDHQIPIVAGALTPAEILRAWQQGADAVKIFPVHSLGGKTYLQALRPVFPDIPLIPTGGITKEDILPLLEAGAIALGMSGYLFPKDRVKAEDWQIISAHMRSVIEIVHQQATQD